MPVLVLQQGHCYRTSGATGTAGEQAFATAVGEACSRLLDGRGEWTVRRILADDPARYYPGGAFLAVHCDGSTNTGARGASVGYRTPEGQALGQAWKRAYAARGWPGFRPDNYTAALAGYYGTGTAVAQGNRRAVIIECGFLTNPDDRALLNGPGGADRVALAIGDALGIPHGQENEMEKDTVLVSGSGYPATVEQWITATSGRAEDLQIRAGRHEAMLAAILANQKDDLDAPAVLAQLDASTRAAITEVMTSTVLPAIQRIEAALAADDTSEAKAIVTELAERLRPAA